MSMNLNNDGDPSVREQYAQLVKHKSPSSPMMMDVIKAFWVGGLICVIGQGFSVLAKSYLKLSQEDASSFTAIVMVFLGATLTGLGVYDRIGKYAGAGSIVPITGFANSVVAPAIEFKREGFILGTGAKLFTIAGPVLVNGYSASVVIGLIYWIWNLW